MMYGAKAYANVGLESGVHSASPHRLIVMLYDGALEAIRKARLYMEMKDPVQKGQSVDKALRIINEGLVAALDRDAGGQLADQLLALYDYIGNELILASARNDLERLDSCSKLLEDLRSAWCEIGHSGSQQNQFAATSQTLTASA